MISDMTQGMYNTRTHPQLGLQHTHQFSIAAKDHVLEPSAFLQVDYASQLHHCPLASNLHTIHSHKRSKNIGFTKRIYKLEEINVTNTYRCSWSFTSLMKSYNTSGNVEIACCWFSDCKSFIIFLL